MQPVSREGNRLLGQHYTQVVHANFELPVCFVCFVLLSIPRTARGFQDMTSGGNRLLQLLKTNRVLLEMLQNVRNTGLLLQRYSV